MNKIMLWEPDRDLRNALTLYIANLGYKPIPTVGYAEFREALGAERPDLCMLPVNRDRGARINFDRADQPLDRHGEISVVLPEFAGANGDRRAVSGLVLDKVRKPFGIRELAGSLGAASRQRDILEGGVSRHSQTLEVRRLAGEEDLLAALRMRYDVYREVGFMDNRELGLDLDPMDFKSTIFGAFVVDGDRSELAGTIRIIHGDGTGPHCRELAAVMRRLGADPARAERTAAGQPLPALATFRLDLEECRRLQPGFATEVGGDRGAVDSGAYELSRLVVGRKFRRHRGGIERRLYELVIAHCRASTPRMNWFAIAVHPSKVRKYVRFGFRNISRLGIQSYPGIEQPAALLVWDLAGYLRRPNPFTADLERNIVQYNWRGALVSELEERQKKDVPAVETEPAAVAG